MAASVGAGRIVLQRHCACGGVDCQRKLDPSTHRCSSPMSRKLSPAVLRAREKPSIGGLFATRVECAEPERCRKSLSEPRFLSQGWELGAFSLKTFSKQKQRPTRAGSRRSWSV